MSFPLLRAMLPWAFLLAPAAAFAQTDYYNLDAGRPLRTEDALVIERHAFEWQVAPLRLMGARGRRVELGLEPELAWGVLPRTQVEVGVPVLFPRGGAGVAGVEVTALHALNIETLTWPALAVRLGAHLPAGPFGPGSPALEVGALATRTFTRGRLHANVAVNAGASDELSTRWEAGIAADRTFVLRSMLVGAELRVEEPAGADAGLEWSTALGIRRQVSPRAAIDLGAGRVLTGGGSWFVTFGSAISFGLLHRLGGPR